MRQVAAGRDAPFSRIFETADRGVQLVTIELAAIAAGCNGQSEKETAAEGVNGSGGIASGRLPDVEEGSQEQPCAKSAPLQAGERAPTSNRYDFWSMASPQLDRQVENRMKEDQSIEQKLRLYCAHLLVSADSRHE